MKFEINNPELRARLAEMPPHARSIAELFVQVLGEEHVLNCLIRQGAERAVVTNILNHE